MQSSSIILCEGVLSLALPLGLALLELRSLSRNAGGDGGRSVPLPEPPAPVFDHAPPSAVRTRVLEHA